MKFVILSKILILASFTFIGIGCTAQRVSDNGQLQEKTDERVKLSIVQFFKDNEHLAMRDRVDRFYELKEQDPTAYDFENEEALNFYGYQLLWNNQDDDAYLIFEMLVSEFPNSANVYDSFAEICLKKGKQELALANYKKSLELNPENFNAEDQIAFLLDPTLKPENPAEKFLKVYSVKEYQQDLDEFGKKIATTHPNVFKFISEKDFWELIEQKKNFITTETTFADFMWHCDEIIASINCAHSSLFGFYQEMDMLPVELCFPLQTSWINERLFVIDPMNNGDVVKVKDEITSINGVAVADLVKGIYKHLPSQGYIETTKRHLFNTWSSCFIPYELNFPDSYTITLNGSGKELELSKAQDKGIYFGDPSIQNCEDALCLEFLNNDEIAILTIKSFDFYKFRDSYPFFESFINDSFSEINSKKCKNLIIDVRGNGGGSQSASIHLLRYLVDHPFTYYSNVQFEGKTEKIEGEDSVDPYEDRFKGNILFLIDGIGNSTTGHFMSIVKVLKLGTIIGEELGSNQFCSAGGKMFRLGSTKLVYTVADNTHESLATSLPDGTGILPDIFVEQSIDDYLNRIDTVKETALKLIANEK